MSRAAAEADRRIGNLIQIGTVTSIDTGKNTARVRIGDLDSPPLPICQYRAGTIRLQWMPSAGERVVVVAPSGDMSRAMIQGALPKAGDAVAPDAQTPTIDLGGGTLSIVGDIAIDGNVEVTGDVVASGVSLVTHTHGDVTPGSGNTGGPN